MSLDPSPPVPLFRAVRHPLTPGIVTFFCPFCRKDHAHGARGVGASTEHRTAHCARDVPSPLHDSGYLLAIPAAGRPPPGKRRPSTVRPELVRVEAIAFFVSSLAASLEASPESFQVDPADAPDVLRALLEASPESNASRITIELLSLAVARAARPRSQAA